MQLLLSLIVLLCILSTSNAGYCQGLTCREGCESYQWLCGRSSGCMWDSSDDNCQTSDGINDANCCLDDTTTTLEPTTDEPTTLPPTTDEPTPKPVTPDPTTKPPTTRVPTPKPVTPEPTETPEPTSTPEPTPDESWPTPRPTLKSAMKWEMIHPNYAGSDGELLWHVYYGDFSNDERFDAFRADEKWDATEIRPILQSDAKFERYSNGQLFNDDATIVSGVHQSAPASASYGMWILMLSIAVIVIFACWYRSSSLASKDEMTGLLEESKAQYN